MVFVQWNMNGRYIIDIFSSLQSNVCYLVRYMFISCVFYICFYALYAQCAWILYSFGFTWSSDWISFFLSYSISLCTRRSLSLFFDFLILFLFSFCFYLCLCLCLCLWLWLCLCLCLYLYLHLCLCSCPCLCVNFCSTYKFRHLRLYKVYTTNAAGAKNNGNKRR